MINRPLIKLKFDYMSSQYVSEISELSRLLKEGTEEQRRKSAIKLGRIRRDTCVPALLEALHDPSPFVRVAAIQSLSWIHSPDMIEPLKKIASSDESKMVRKNAVEILSRLNGSDYPNLSEFLTSLLASEQDEEIKEIIQNTL